MNANMKRSAEEGDANAQYQYGVACCVGDGCDVDYEEAAKWFMKAAEQGHLPAKRELGIMYLSGEGVEIDANKAFSLLSETAKSLDPNAMYHLALMYEKGFGCEKDLYMAVKFLAFAASMNYPGAEQDADRIDGMIREERIKKLRARPVLNLDISDVDVEAACCKKMLDDMMAENVAVIDTFSGPQLIGEDEDGNDLVIGKCPYCGKAVRKVSRYKTY